MATKKAKTQTPAPTYDANLIATAKAIPFGGNKLGISTLTEPSFVGGKACPFTGRVFKYAYRYSTWHSDYRTSCVNKFKQAGMTQAQAEEEFDKKECKSSYNHVEGMVSELKSDPRKLYVTVMQKQDDLSSNEEYYILDGRRATDEEVAEIKKCLTPHSTNARLDAVGVKKDDQFVFNRIKLENVLYLQQGKNVWGKKECCF